MGTDHPEAEAESDTQRLTRDAMLAQRFVALADTLVDDYDVVDVLDRLVNTCVELLGVDEAGLLLVDQRGGLQLVASSSEATRLLELFQIQGQEGPCVDAVRTGRPVVATDLDDRAADWPAFVTKAQGAGFTSVYAIPMRLRNETIGGLNLFSVQSPPLGPSDQRVAQALSDVATIGIIQQRSIHRVSLVAEQLQSALNTRVSIEQAKGVLSERGSLDMDHAFVALRSFARDNHRKLGEVASGVVSGTVSPDEVLAARHSG